MLVFMPSMNLDLTAPLYIAGFLGCTRRLPSICPIAFEMKRRNNVAPRNSRGFQSDGPNWVLIAGGALLSTLSVRLGFKLKQVLDTKRAENVSSILKGNGKSTDEKKSQNSQFHSDAYCFPEDENGCHNCCSGPGKVVEMKQHCNGQMVSEPEITLPLVTVPASEYSKENGVMWASSPDRLELPHKPFHRSNSSDSPCVSESGSDNFSKREVIHKLRQQLKRRDDMILEMQDKIIELQNSLSAQLSHSSHLQTLLDAANRDLFDSEREIQRLRKAIADHCVGHVNPIETPPTWNGHSNGFLKVESNLESSEKGRGDEGKIEMLRCEVNELKEVIEGKEYLLQSYKDQKTELSEKIKELQYRLDSQLPHIL